MAEIEMSFIHSFFQEIIVECISYPRWKEYGVERNKIGIHQPPILYRLVWDELF